ncbi:MAG: 30S ribosomal protein S20 [Spirochaetaceae bacterium]|nr:30S ribosomal protein S20 [Spirochaetaceae bacterium]
MPSNLSAAKRQRQNQKRRLRNRAALSRVRTTIRTLREAVGDESATAEQMTAVTRQLDRAVSKGVLKRNTAARRKRRLQRLVAGKLAS